MRLASDLIAGKITSSKSDTVAPRTVIRNVALSVTTLGAVPACVKIAPTMAPFGKTCCFIILID